MQDIWGINGIEDINSGKTEYQVEKSFYGGDLDLRIDRKQWKLRIVDSVWSLDRN